VEASLCTAMLQVGLRQRVFTANPRRCGHRKCHIDNPKVSRDHNQPSRTKPFLPSTAPFAQSKWPKQSAGSILISQSSGPEASSPSPSPSACHQTTARSSHPDSSVPSARWQLRSAIHRSGLMSWRLGRRTHRNLPRLASHPPHLITAEGIS
jgi:hypothetical protein